MFKQAVLPPEPTADNFEDARLGIQQLWRFLRDRETEYSDLRHRFRDMYQWWTNNSGVCLSAYIDQNTRNQNINVHGNLNLIAAAEAINSGASSTQTYGISKIVIVVDTLTTAGTLTITGTKVDRDTGAETASYADTIFVGKVSTDNTDTDAQSNNRYAFDDAYITSVWFKGSVVISTSDANIVADLYQVSFEQFNDQAEVVIDTFDLTTTCTNTAAWLYAYLYKVAVRDSHYLTLSRIASLSVPVGDSDANVYYRLRLGNLNQSFTGTTDGLFAQIHPGPSASTYWNDMSIKIWGRVNQP